MKSRPKAAKGNTVSATWVERKVLHLQVFVLMMVNSQLQSVILAKERSWAGVVKMYIFPGMIYIRSLYRDS